VVGKDQLDKACRIYAPVGSHETLLAYLVRRLLENGANSSFVNQIVDQDVSIDTLIADPFEAARAQRCLPHPGIALPRQLFGSERANSAGLDLSNEDVLTGLAATLSQPRRYAAAPLIAGHASTGAAHDILNPANHGDLVGTVVDAEAFEVDTALAAADAYAPVWQAETPAARAAIVMRVADLFEQHCQELMALAVREAGKSLPNAIAEVREAVDFLRYYAQQAAINPAVPALGPVTCISPWNFPLAIFTGQVAASLVAGNVVLAKPAEQTPLIAHRAVELFYEAGVPAAALQLLPGRGEVVGAALTKDSRVRGVIFTGSTEVAQLINRTLAQRSVQENVEIALIAETGGQNALIVDSSALPEQVVQDALSSAFDSAGQRCSALRVLFLQEDIADKTLRMLKGAMQELRVGVPDRLATDIGPVIDSEARDNLLAHIARTRKTAKSHFALDLPESLTANGTFVPPTVMEIGSLAELTKEVFGPVLHVIRYRRADLPQLVESVNASGFGLTLGVHSRIDETIDFIAQRAHVGNIYINRNIVGAVVGVQPFGGEGKSGTGPKAGGPLYLKRLQAGAAEQEISIARTPAAYPALDALAASQPALASLINLYRSSSPAGASLVLPGPTGERNTLSFAERGHVLCLAETPAVLMNQLAAVFATGNRALVLSKQLPAGLPAAVLQHIDQVASIEAIASPFQIALVEAGTAAAWSPVLAARDGALVSLIDTSAGGAIPLWRLVAERALCVNTTAAGGNASLMTLGL